MKIELLCLGVGHGSSYVLDGVTSSSYVIKINSKPFILIDCGDGVALEFEKYFNNLAPQYIYISHNHSDHTGDLPLVLSDFYRKTKQPITVLGHPEVIEIVRKIRMHEFVYSGINIDAIANWCSSKDDLLSLDDSFSLELIKTRHTYICYGFNLKYKDRRILGFSADSGFSMDLYSFLAQSDIIILDGNPNGNKEHASFSDIIAFSTKIPTKQILVSHHGLEKDIPDVENVNFLEKGELICLLEE